jgi:hypothetical protein
MSVDGTAKHDIAGKGESYGRCGDARRGG